MHDAFERRIVEAVESIARSLDEKYKLDYHDLEKEAETKDL